MTTNIEAESFMKLLSELQHKYVEPLHADLKTFLASSAFAPVQKQLTILTQTVTHAEQEALALEIEKEAIKLGTIKIGGVEVLVNDVTANFHPVAEVEVTLQPNQCLLVQVLDFRNQESTQVLYNQAFEVPSEFHKLLRERCFKKGVNVGVPLSIFERRVREALADAGMELFVYDRPAKLRALLAS